MVLLSPPPHPTGALTHKAMKLVMDNVHGDPQAKIAPTSDAQPGVEVDKPQWWEEADLFG